MRIIKNRLGHGNMTSQHPLRGNEMSYGRIVCKPGACEACGVCEALCPTHAIRYDTSIQHPVWDEMRCIHCQNCVMACPNRRLVNTHDDLMASIEPYGLAKEEESIGKGLHDAIMKRYGRSLMLRSVDTGSCNACMLELSATLNPFYALQKYGVDFAASPRHADGIVVTGPVAINMREALIKTYEALSSPRIVIGVGSCTHVGGIFENCYGNVAPLHEILPVDLVIPGCPPSPRAIMNGMFQLIGKETDGLK